MVYDHKLAQIRNPRLSVSKGGPSVAAMSGLHSRQAFDNVEVPWLRHEGRGPTQLPLQFRRLGVPIPPTTMFPYMVVWPFPKQISMREMRLRVRLCPCMSLMVVARPFMPTIFNATTAEETIFVSK